MIKAKKNEGVLYVQIVLFKLPGFLIFSGLCF